MIMDYIKPANRLLHLATIGIAVLSIMLASQASATTPTATISVDNHNNGDTIYIPANGSAIVSVRYSATDSGYDLQGIRYNVWNVDTSYFDNGGGGFVAESGSYGQVQKNITLNSAGNWYFWTDAQDRNNYSSSGPWYSGFHITVKTLPSVTISGAPAIGTYGTTITPMVNATKGTDNLQTVILYYSWDNINWTQLGATPYPSNPSDSEGNPIGLGQNGILYLKGSAWDTNGMSATCTTQVRVSDSNGFFCAVDNSAYGYGYAPSICYLNGIYHMFYGSGGDPSTNPYGLAQEWDVIRYASSTDGVNWTNPQIVLRVSNNPEERAACDPSVVYFNGYYYMFYSGNSSAQQTVMFVARSTSITGPFYKYTKRGTWEVGPNDPKIILGPKVPCPDQPNAKYGAGEQTVVVVNVGGVQWLYSWYYDDTGPQGGAIYFTKTQDPTFWQTPVAINGGPSDPSVDVKFDASIGKFVMYYVSPQLNHDSAIKKQYSTDGLNWDAPQVVFGVGACPRWIHNLGMTGDFSGNYISNKIMAFGAPRHLVDEIYWGQWDLYAKQLSF